MNYVNPFELLGLRIEDPNSVQSDVLSRAKKKLLAEIELSDSESIEFHNKSLTKSDCIRIVDELDNKDTREFHFYILYNKDLRNFLTNGSLSFFKNYRVEGIYKTQDFIDFISPYFTTEYDQLLSKYYKERDIENLRWLLAEKPLTNETYIDQCYAGTYALILKSVRKYKGLVKKIEESEGGFSLRKFSEIAATIIEDINEDTLNLLPLYFQNIRSQLAESIEQLSVVIHNKPYQGYRTAFQMIQVAREIDADGLVKQRIEKAFPIIKANYDSLQYQEREQEEEEYEDGKEEDGSNNEEGSADEKQKGQYVRNTGMTSFHHNSDNEAVEKVLDNAKQIHKLRNAETGYGILSIYLLAFNLLALFKDPIKYIALAVSTFVMVQSLWTVIMRKESTFWKILRDYILIIIVCLLGFFDSRVATFAISYIAILSLNGVYNLLVTWLSKNKRVLEWWGFYACFIGAVLVSLLVESYKIHQTQLGSDIAVASDTESRRIFNAKTPEDHYQKGKELGDKGDYNAALIELQKAIDLNENYIDAYNTRGYYYLQLENFNGAINDYNKLIQLDDNDAEIFLNRGFAKYKLGQSEEAVKDYNKSIELNPEYSRAYRNRGDIKYDSNDDKGAAADYTLAIKYDDDNPSHYFVRGLAYYYSNQYNKAISDMDRAIELSPKISQYYYDRGDVKQAMGDIEGACADWKTSKELGYSVPDYKVNKFTPSVIQMETGNISGCSFQPKYAYPSLDNYLKIVVRNTDVAIKLVNAYSHKCIRFVFINKYTTFSMTNIPEGKYYLKIAYGKNWEKTSLETECQGRFRDNTIFKKGDQMLDFNLVDNIDSYSVPSFELELDVIQVEGQDDYSSFRSSNITEEDFYN